jgi:hypothetical protein
VITYNDALIVAGDVLRRVMGIHWRYDRVSGRYEHEVRLGPR